MPKAFRLNWESENPFFVTDRIWIRDSGDGLRIRAGDDVYVVSESTLPFLIGRLGVLGTDYDRYRSRINLLIGGPRTAVFFRSLNRAAVIRIPSIRQDSAHREAWQLDSASTAMIDSACGNYDFSLSRDPARWHSVVHRVYLEIRRKRVRGSTAPDIEIAEDTLRRNFVTSELPGPSPVYQIAARRALGMDIHLVPGVKRNRSHLTNEAIQKAINEDVALSGQLPESRRHQDILERLCNRLTVLGYSPKYDGLVDCIVELESIDVYFEIKSTSPGSIASQVRMGLGQILHYMWLDIQSGRKNIVGHLVVEGPWAKKNESLKEFARSLSIRLVWSEDIESLELH